jgi:hypothetical protein
VTPAAAATRDLPYLIGFVSFFTIPFIVHCVRVWRGAVRLPATRSKGAGGRLFGPLVISYYYW